MRIPFSGAKYRVDKQGGEAYPYITKTRRQGMLAKMTSKNQITIPKKIVNRLPDTRHFDIEMKDGVVLLKPVKIYDASLESIRSKIEKLELKPDCVQEAVAWVRSKK
jgi:hypothetical protein